MSAEPFIEKQEANLSFHIFTVSAGMVGVCLTVIGIIRVLAFSEKMETIVDDMTAINAIVFLVACMISYFAIKRQDRKRRLLLEKIADIIFLLALVLMVFICFLIVLKR